MQPGKPNLSRELIARSALAMTDEVGLGGLSMRKLGGLLGVEAMSLYHYIDNKADLLDAVLDCLFGELDLPQDIPADDWEQAIRVGMTNFRKVLLAHPAAPELFATRPAAGPEAWKVLLWWSNRLQAVGLDVVQAGHAFRFGVSWVLGHVVSELGAMQLAREADRMGRFGEFGPEVEEHMKTTASVSTEDLFRSGLDGVVAGVRAMYDLG